MIGRTNTGGGGKLFAAIGVTYPEGSICTCTGNYLNTVNGALATFTSKTKQSLPELSVDIEPMQEGSGDPSPENVRPISGWTGANVTRTGKNLVAEMYVGMIASATGALSSGAVTYASSDFILVKPGETYTFSQKSYVAPSAGGSQGVAFYNQRKEFISYETILAGSAVLSLPKTFTVPDGAVYARFRIFYGTSLLSPPTDVMCEIGSTVTEYEPYQGETYAITFPAEAGTVYGGTLDVTTGVLTVGWRMVDMGTLTYGHADRETFRYFWSTTLNQTGANRKANGALNLKCSQYRTRTGVTNQSTSVNNTISGETASGAIFVRDDRYATLTDSEFKAAMSGVQLVYALANPISYQLTPQEVTTLLGVNNISADTGDVSVKYYVSGKTLTAKTTSGQWLFSIPETGPWTVSCTDGMDTASKTVEISAEGQSESVKLSYWDGKLYIDGDQYYGMTGGWGQAASLSFQSSAGAQYKNTCTATFDTTMVSMSVNNFINTNKPISFTGYTRLHMKYTTTSSDAQPSFGVTDSLNGAFNEGSNSLAFKDGPTGENIEITIDISSIVSGYVVAGLSNGSMNVLRLWMT